MSVLIARIRESLKTHGVAGSAIVCLRLPLSPFLKSDFGVRLSRAYYDWVFDRRFGVNTSGFIPQPVRIAGGGNPRLGSAYDGSNPVLFMRIVQDIKIGYENYTFVDFGSGKGRVLLLASAFPFRRVVGVEWSHELHEDARRNLKVYTGPRACDEIESFCMDAGCFPIPSGPLVLYFFNPFKDEVMTKVLQNIGRALEAEPREIILVYVNPRFKGAFDAATFLEKTTDKGWFAVYRTVPPEHLKRRPADVPANCAADEMRVLC
jgi:SAM-dependent methyltransferase